MKHYLLILCLLPAFAKAQQSADFLRKAISANGHWEDIPAFKYRANRYTLNPWQSYAFDQPKAEKGVLNVDFDKANSRFYHHTINQYPGGYVFNFARIGRDQAYYVYDVIGARTGKSLIKLGQAQYQGNFHSLLTYFPYYILKEVLDSGDTLQLKHLNGEVVITRSLNTGSQQLWLDEQTGILHSYNNNKNGKTSTWYFDDYTTVKGYQVPGKVKQVIDSTLTVTDHLISFDVVESILPSRFEVPAGYTTETIIHQPLTANEIEKDIYLVEKVDDDRNIVFINMQDHVVLAEAPVSEDITTAIINLIHKTLPGKPIKYVHLSHFHNDHIAGIRKLIEEGATIICTPSMETPLRKMLAGATPSFLFFNGHKRIGDSHLPVDIFEIPNSHALGLSFIYFPRKSIIYEGDLLSVPEDGTITPAIQVSKEFYHFLKKHKLSYHRIIGHHGLSNITPAMFDKIIKEQ
ncbi:MBL fold metallo-hydrolase [Chitinophaga defluvii]|uniref:MBL fold metallo-hydrolase n=1 Tax=Chitinophaga defluvii TaxID=3163343 RepID=A0ABV2TEA0_9BACT